MGHIEVCLIAPTHAGIESCPCNNRMGSYTCEIAYVRGQCRGILERTKELNKLWESQGSAPAEKGDNLMGNNQAYSIFEAIVIAIYDKGVLDVELLSTIMEQFRNMDIDSGGQAGTLSKDGLEIEQIVIKIFGGELPTKIALPDDYKTWTKEQQQQSDDYYESIGIAFNEITDKIGW